MPTPPPDTTASDYDISDYGLNPEVPEIMDSSRLKDFVECPARFYLKHVLGLEHKSRSGSAALEWGTKWHDVMYAFHHDRDVSEALEALDPWPEEILNSQDKYNRTKGRMETLLLKYIDKFGVRDRNTLEQLRREQYFEIICEEDDPDCPFGGCGLSWCGRMDKIVRSQARNWVYVWDYKTTGYKRKNYFDDLKHGFQIRGYVWAAYHLIPSARRISAKIDLLHCTKTMGDFYRRELRFNTAQLMAWVKEVKSHLQIMDTMLESWPRSPEEWPKNWQDCERFWECQFTDAHHQPDIRDNRLKTLEGNYVENRWDPSELVED